MYAGSLAWSPEGQRIAYTDGDCTEGGGSTVRVVNADGSGLVTPKHSNYCLAGPVWSPDGKTLVAGDGQSNYANGGIEALDPAGGPSRWLAPPQQGTAALELRDIKTGKLLRQWQLLWERPVQTGAKRGLVYLSGRYLLTTYWRPGTGYVLERYDTKNGTLLGRTRWPTAAGSISLAGRHGVYSLGRRIYLLDAKSGRRSLLIRAPQTVWQPIITGKHVLWYENQKKAHDHYSSRIREIVLP